MHPSTIITEILKERIRQDHIHPDNDLSDYLAILVEEVGEIARAIQLRDIDNLKEELIQLSAVCIRWMEDLEL
jgi:NTP pyrophosphatase (non-canonical NTP hydrolase)